MNNLTQLKSYTLHLLQYFLWVAILTLSGCNGCNSSSKLKKTPDSQDIPSDIQDDDIKLTFIDLPSNRVFIGKQEIKFRIKNNGDDISTDDIRIELTSTDYKAIFKLGNQVGSIIYATLTEILGLGLAKKLANMEESNQLTLQLEDAKLQTATNVILTLKYKGKEFKHKLQWRQQENAIVLDFLNFPDDKVLNGKESLNFQIQNSGIDVDTKDIKIQFAATNGVSFRLGGKTGDTFKTTLRTVLGLFSKSIIANGEHTEDIVLELDKANRQDDSIITLSVAYENITKTRTIKWQAGKLQIIELETFTGTNEATFKLKNETSTVIDARNLKIELQSEPRGLDFEFIRNYLSPITSPVSLEKLLIWSSINIGQNTDKLGFKLKHQPSLETANIIVVVKRKSDGAELAKKTITWTKKHIKLNIARIHPPILQGIANTEFKVDILNSGIEEAESSKMQLQVRRIKGMTATVAGATENADLFTIDLASLGNLPRYNSTRTHTVKIVPNEDHVVVFECQLLYAGYPVGEKKMITWIDAPKIKITTSDTNLRGDNKKVQLNFFNESGFDLEEQMLKGIKLQVNNLKKGIKLRYIHHTGSKQYFSNGSNLIILTDILGENFKNNQTKSIDIEIDNAQESKVVFELELIGSTSLESDKKLSVSWVGEPKITASVEDSWWGSAPTERKLTFRNKGEFKLTTKNMENVKIQLNNLTQGAQVMYGNPAKPINGAKLIDVLGKDAFKNYDLDTKIINIIPGINKRVDFELELIGSTSAENQRKVRVEWELDILSQLEIEPITPNLDKLKGTSAKEFKIKIINSGTFRLNKEDLAKIELFYKKSDFSSFQQPYQDRSSGGKITIKGSNLDANGMNLLQVLDKEEMEPKSSQDITLVIDNEGEKEVKFSVLGLKLALRATYYVSSIVWIRDMIDFKLEEIEDLTSLEGDDQKDFSIRITNTSNFELGESELKKINFSFYSFFPSFVQKKPGKVLTRVTKQDITKMNLWEVLALTKPTFAPGESKSIALTIDNQGAHYVEFDQLELKSSTLRELNDEIHTKHRIEWYADLSLCVFSFNIEPSQPSGATINTKLGFAKPGNKSLPVDELKKVKIKLNNLPGDMTIQYKKGGSLAPFIDGITVGDLLGESLPGNYDEKEVEIIIHPGASQKFEFQVELEGSNAEEDLRKATIKWPMK